MLHEQITGTNDANLLNALEYTSTVWSPWLNNDIEPLELRPYAGQSPERSSGVGNLGRGEEPCSADGNIQVHEQLTQNPARMWEDERTFK